MPRLKGYRFPREIVAYPYVTDKLRRNANARHPVALEADKKRTINREFLRLAPGIGTR